MSKPRRTKAQRVERAVLAFSPGNRIVSEDYFISELRPLGITRYSFRSLLRALSVPSFEIGRTRFVDAFSFGLALRAVLRIGQPDFLAPTAATKRLGRKALASRFTTRLDTAYFEKHSAAVIAELLACRKLSGHAVTRETLSAAREAARRMALAGFHSLPAREQARHAASLVHTLTPEITPDAPSRQRPA